MNQKFDASTLFAQSINTKVERLDTTKDVRCVFHWVWSRYLSWDDYFMSIAFLSAKRSKDPNRQVS
jgi:deoxycytidylate deaminase